MTDFLLRLLIGCLVSVGWWNAFKPGMIMGWLGKIWDRRLPEELQKPLYSCPPCLASTVGTGVWFFFGGDLTFWPAFVLALSGLNRLVSGKLL